MTRTPKNDEGIARRLLRLILLVMLPVAGWWVGVNSEREELPAQAPPVARTEELGAFDAGVAVEAPPWRPATWKPRPLPPSLADASVMVAGAEPPPTTKRRSEPAGLVVIPTLPSPASPASPGSQNNQLSVVPLLTGADTFPWSGLTRLETADGGQLTWLVERVQGEVVITGTHPKWKVVHHARRDGAPLWTVREAGGRTVRIDYSADGAQLRAFSDGGVPTLTSVRQQGLVDGDTLDAHLAGIDWRPGLKIRMKVADVDASPGEVYPMVAEYVALQQCGDTPCHRVHLALDDFRRLFAPTYEYFFAAAPGARYLRFEGDGLVFTAK